MVWDSTRGCVICRGREVVGGAADGEGASVEDVGVYHRGADVIVTQEFLHGAKVVAVFKEMPGERMPQRVAGGPLVNACLTHGIFHGPLDRAFVNMVTIQPAVLPVAVVMPRRKHPLP